MSDSELRNTDKHAGRARWQGETADWHRQRSRDKITMVLSASRGRRHAQ